MSRVYSRFLAVLLLLLVFGCGFYLLGHSKAKIKAAPFYSVAANIQSPSVVNGKLDFFTGSSFAQLDLSTAKSTSLSGYFYTTGQIIPTSWSPESVIFSVSGTSQGDQFNLAINRAGGDSSQTHWWRYDFDKHQLQLIDFSGADDCINIVEYSGNLFCFKPHLGSAHQFDFYSYSLNGGGLKQLYQTQDPVSLVQEANGLVYYLTTSLSGTQIINRYNPQSNSSSAVYTSAEAISGYSVSSGGTIMVDQVPLLNNVSLQNRGGDGGENVKHKLALLNSSGTVVDSKDFSVSTEHLSASGSTSLLAASSGASYEEQSGKLVAASTLNAQQVSFLFENNATTYYVDPSNNLYRSSKGLTPALNNGSFTASKNLTTNRFNIGATYQGQNQVFIYNTHEDFSGNANDVAGFLKSLNYDPNQFNIVWNLDQSSTHIPVTDNAQILK